MEPSHEDHYFEVEIEFRGFLFTPDMATVHLFTNKKFNLVAIALEDHRGYAHELIGLEEAAILRASGVMAVEHGHPSPTMNLWYEQKINQMAGELVVETSEFIEFNA